MEYSHSMKEGQFLSQLMYMCTSTYKDVKNDGRYCQMELICNWEVYFLILVYTTCHIIPHLFCYHHHAQRLTTTDTELVQYTDCSVVILLYV